MIAKRIKAFLVDYGIILLYIIFLFGVSMLLSKLFSFPLNADDPFWGELIGFLTLTLPVILYFTFSENSNYAGTMGKRKYGLKVVNYNLSKATFSQLLLRNAIKFLPWEMAHFFVFKLFYFSRIKANTPSWVMSGLIASQMLALTYLILLVFNKHHQSGYETLSKTRVIDGKNA
jgi:uncharacterized RDD family membrane protein YckC